MVVEEEEENEEEEEEEEEAWGGGVGGGRGGRGGGRSEYLESELLGEVDMVRLEIVFHSPKESHYPQCFAWCICHREKKTKKGR